VDHAPGEVVTGWKYKDGASAADQPTQYCYYTELNSNHTGSAKVDIAQNGRRLYNDTVSMVPNLEGALAKCHWWHE
jgi:hypothetical protein